jgi:hypothetical protein
MRAVQIVGIGLIALGVLGLVYGGFSYTSERHQAEIGPVQVNIEERDTVPIPLWAGIAAIAVGAGLLLTAGRRKA